MSLFPSIGQLQPPCVHVVYLNSARCLIRVKVGCAEPGINNLRSDRLSARQKDMPLVSEITQSLAKHDARERVPFFVFMI
jgi:hypothetical protein